MLGSSKVACTAAASAALAPLLAVPPPLERINECTKQVPHYEHVPETPPPRKNKYDHAYYNPQKKLEAAMHMLVHFLEKGSQDESTLGHIAALQRSVWEDLQQSRRSLLAAKDQRR